MTININDNDYNVLQISPLAYDLDAKNWKPIHIVTEHRISLHNKEVETILVKDYMPNYDAVIVLSKEPQIIETHIILPDVSYCTLLVKQ